MDKDPADCTFSVLVKRVSDGVMCFGALSSFHGFRVKKNKGTVQVDIDGHNLVPGIYNIDTQIRTISHDKSYAAYRESRLIVNYPPDRYILKNLAGVYQPANIEWRATDQCAAETFACRSLK